MCAKRLEQSDHESGLADAPKIFHPYRIICISGASGTGKRRLARYIHDQCPTRSTLVHLDCEPFHEITLKEELFGNDGNASSGPSGLAKAMFWNAHQGILVLENAPSSIQQEIVHRLTSSEGSPDVVVIFIFRQSIDELAENGSLLPGFQEKISEYIQIDPLRKRPFDAALILREELQELGLMMESDGVVLQNWDAESQDLVANHDWPDNREGLIWLIDYLRFKGMLGSPDAVITGDMVKQALADLYGPNAEALKKEISRDLLKLPSYGLEGISYGKPSDEKLMAMWENKYVHSPRGMGDMFKEIGNIMGFDKPNSLLKKMQRIYLKRGLSFPAHKRGRARKPGN